jgi:lipid A disaccharide synthetase|tara:strand:+ start:34 stop:210 length:177 start_codon:yes stop_codon:yes gene_type:complete
MEGIRIMDRLRVDVDYVVGRIEEVIYSDKTDVTIALDMEEFLIELKENLKNHERKNNG